MKPRLLAAALIFVFIFSCFAPVFAQHPATEEKFYKPDPNAEIGHTVVYSINGRIDLLKQAGHLCNTGAEMLQVISGSGQLNKETELVIIEGKITVSDNNDFFTAAEALSNLTVTTAIELCTPAKPDPDQIMIRSLAAPKASLINGDYFYRDRKVLTKQIWAASVSADPGYSGTLSNKFTAAYESPFSSDYMEYDSLSTIYLNDISPARDRLPYWWGDDYYIDPEYLGDFFSMEQFAHVSKGTVKRYIDISSPYSHAMLHEDMAVTGSAEIIESFTMQNFAPGENLTDEWWKLLGINPVAANLSTAKERFLTHDAQYFLSGSIDLKKQAGHQCNTGAEMKQVISGNGEFAKKMDIYMIEGLLVVDDDNSFTTAPDSLRNLTVSSVIELCAPPKQIHTGNNHILHFTGIDWPFHGWIPSYQMDDNSWHPIYLIGGESLVFGPYSDGDVVNPLLHPHGLYGRCPCEPAYAVDVSEQIWAVSVEADPGHTGLLDMSFEAAHGPYGGYIPDPSGSFYLPFELGTIEYKTSSDRWWISTDGRGIFPVLGSNFVGNYFTIDQHAKTTGGSLKRYIDISSPWSHGYFKEDMSVSGISEVKEYFEMNNLPAGAEGTAHWWDLSDKGSYTVFDDYYLPGLYVENLSVITTGSADLAVSIWLDELLWHYGRTDLYAELYDLYLNNQWDDLFSTLESEIGGFDRGNATGSENLIHLPPFIIVDLPWPYRWFWNIF
jgi:hypothetical protein